jgi:hypothetical protein
MPPESKLTAFPGKCERVPGIAYNNNTHICTRITHNAGRHIHTHISAHIYAYAHTQRVGAAPGDHRRDPGPMDGRTKTAGPDQGRRDCDKGQRIGRARRRFSDGPGNSQFWPLTIGQKSVFIGKNLSTQYKRLYFNSNLKNV